jgi:hypothetical protein
VYNTPPRQSRSIPLRLHVSTAPWPLDVSMSATSIPPCPHVYTSVYTPPCLHTSMPPYLHASMPARLHVGIHTPLCLRASRPPHKCKTTGLLIGPSPTKDPKRRSLIEIEMARGHPANLSGVTSDGAPATAGLPSAVAHCNDLPPRPPPPSPGLHTSVPTRLYLYTSMPPRLHAYTPPYLHASVPPCLHASPRLHASMPTRLHASTPTCLHAYMPPRLHASTPPDFLYTRTSAR